MLPELARMLSVYNIEANLSEPTILASMMSSCTSENAGDQGNFTILMYILALDNDQMKLKNPKPNQ